MLDGCCKAAQKKRKIMILGVYGFVFSEKIEIGVYTLIPCSNKITKESKDSINSRHEYKLSGFICTNGLIDNSFLFDLEAVLSFCQQQNVIIRNEFTSLSEIPLEKTIIIADIERRKTSSYILELNEIQLPNLVNKLFNKLNERNDVCNDDFRALVFNSIEVNRLRAWYSNISYYLLFSSLEAFCSSYNKKKINNGKKHPRNYAPYTIARTLEELKIPYIYHFVQKNKTTNSDKAKEKFNNALQNMYGNISNETDYTRMLLDTYSNLRNKLFHNNKLEAEIEGVSGKKEIVSIGEYELFLHKLIIAVIIKYIDFTDKHFNVAKWPTRIVFYDN
jgi:hypothetical protein